MVLLLSLRHWRLLPVKVQERPKDLSQYAKGAALDARMWDVVSCIPPPPVGRGTSPDEPDGTYAHSVQLDIHSAT